MRQSEAVSLFFLPAVLSTTPTHGHFVLSPVSLALRDPHLHLRLHGKIGHCEQSTGSWLRGIYFEWRGILQLNPVFFYLFIYLLQFNGKKKAIHTKFETEKVSSFCFTVPVSCLTHHNNQPSPAPHPHQPGKQSKWPPIVMPHEISNKNLYTHHHISWKAFTSSLCHNSVGWPLQVVDFFCESSKFSLKSFKLPLVSATTSSSIYGRQWGVDWS